MNERIVNPALMIKMLRDAGYKNTSYAVAELVDNSIEAKAKNIDILIFNKDVVNIRRSTRISSIAIFDDGEGMDKEVLSRCLSFGWGTRLTGATGLGKFGFGLKGASISQAKRIEVYSWQDPKEINKSYLDVDEIVDDEIDFLPAVEAVDLPKVIRNQLPKQLPSSGTVVVWKNLDRLNPKRAATLVDHLNKEMCRIFRHFMDDDDKLGSRRNITVKVLEDDGTISEDKVLQANDPMYLLVPNNLPGHENDATNIVEEDVTIGVIDPDGIERNVRVISSVALPNIQATGGNSEVGKHYANNNGISFVRAGRELELDIKGFFSHSEPRHRWHGIEIQFDPHLDEYFGVPNNKQSVRNFKRYDEAELEGLEHEKAEGEGAEKHAAAMKLELFKIVSRMVKNNETTVKSRGASKTEKLKPNQKSVAKKVSDEISQIEPNEETRSSEEARTKTHDEKLSELIDTKRVTDTSLSYQEALELASRDLENLLQIEEATWPGTTFLDVQFKANAAVATINRNHPFFVEFYDFLRNSDDKKAFVALKILMLAFARTEDVLQNKLGSEAFEAIRDRWGYYMKEAAKHSS